MTNGNIPSNSELPSIAKLIKSTILAICAAALILVTIVLPAEYGIDPTGVGELTGLLKMGEIKVSLAEEAATERGNDNIGAIQESETAPEDVSEEAPKSVSEEVATESNSSAKSNSRSDSMTVVLNPNQGKEIKLTMEKGARVKYVWWTSHGRANFDTHADSKELQINYHNYEKGSAERSEGILEAAFDGNHGWFWRNRTSELMTVTLQVSGQYSNVIKYE